MRIKCMVVSAMEENCYIVGDEDTKEGIIIDPGAEGDSILEFVEKEGINIKAIVLTHSHFDHIGAVNQIKNKLCVDVLCSAEEKQVAESAIYNLSANFGMPFSIKIDKTLVDGEEYSFGSLKFKTILTPGHTIGGACFYFENEGVLFSGDTLFRMSVGRSDFPLGDGEELINSIKNKLFELPDYVQVFPGHGDVTTIGYEKEYNMYV